ncbi:hypothetical protein [Martelella soudanensis]|uniref:hypothetical protein n=1 Tax=unclassified Martelella TaxID=2629616 RepID=UPI0015DEC90D|nr:MULTISPECIES: hypothetical protein [unclassified Martelella]
MADFETPVVDAGGLKVLIDSFDAEVNAKLGEKAAVNPAFIIPPPPTNPLIRLLKVEIYTSVNGTSVALPARLCVREIARDANSGGRFRLRFASYDGVSTYTEEFREYKAGAGAGYIAVSGSEYTGLVWIDLLTLTTNMGVPISTKIGRALVDFGGGEVFGTYFSLKYDYDEGGYRTNALQLSNVYSNDISESIEESQSYSPDGKKPFAAAMTGSKTLRRFVRGINVYGAEPSHRYTISNCSISQFGSPTNLTRMGFEIYDEDLGVAVCSTRKDVASGTITFADFIAAIPNTLKLTDNLLATKTGMYAVLDLDWSAVTAYFANLGGTTTAAAGIHPDNIYSAEDVADYLDTDRWDQVIRVGAGETYTTLRAAVEATYSPISGATLINGSPICEFAHYNNRVLIDVVDDGEFNMTGLYSPEWVEFRMNGEGGTIVRRENTDPEPLLEQRITGKIFDCTMISDTPSEYCIHSDDFNRNMVGGINQTTRLMQSYKRVKMVGGEGHDGWLFGCGISSGQAIYFEDVTGEHLDPDATRAAFGFHNSGPTLASPTIKHSYKPARVVMRGCSSPDRTAIELSTLATSAVCSLTLIDCDFPGLIRIGTAGGFAVRPDLAKDRNAWRIGGVLPTPFLREDPIGENVLKTTAGETASGDAAALIFGTVDEFGRGDKFISAPNDNAIGQLIGNCTVISQTLTIGGETHTFTENESVKSNATILSEINASITSYPVSIPAGENVLKTTAGEDVGGTVGGNLFGTVDGTGRGSVMMGNSLGEKLGDCSSTSKSLTIGGETHTFNTNLRATSNGDILSAINASITTYPVSIVDIQFEWVPDAAPKRRVLNNTNSTIEKGRFAKLTGTKTIATCGEDDRPEGWIYRDILAGDNGHIALSRQIARPYLPGPMANLAITGAGSGGTNGTFALLITGGGGSGAAGTFTVSGGVVTSVAISDRGDGYTSAPTITITGSVGLTGATAEEVATEFGVDADGKIDYDAAMKRGRMAGGVVRIY